MYLGSCLCGAVRYVIRSNIECTSLCWCTMCQKQHGAACGPYANVAAADLVYLQGADAITRYASSPGVERTFCKVCGSNLTWRLSDATPDCARVAVTLGTFDTPYEGKVSHALHTDRKPGWLP